MDKKDVIEAIKESRKNSKERKFVQSFDVVVNLKNLNVKKEAERVNTFTSLPNDVREKVHLTALVGQELSSKAKACCDEVILQDDFKKLEKKAIKRLAQKTDYFVAQANIMPKVAATFGRTLGARGLMPNPKIGCVVPPTGEIKPLTERLKKVIKLETKGEATIKASVGKASLDDDAIAENILSMFNAVLHAVPRELNNIKNTYVKLTMGPAVLIGKEQKKVKKDE